MKTLILLLTAFSFASCSSDSPGPDPSLSVTGKITYKIAGQSVEFDNQNALSGQFVYFTKQVQSPGIPRTRYSLTGQAGSASVFLSSIIVDSLRVGNYRQDSINATVSSGLTTVKLNSQQSMLFYGSDYIEYNITSHSNGRISGTFTGKLSPTPLTTSTKGTVLITDGVINNVPVIY